VAVPLPQANGELLSFRSQSQGLLPVRAFFRWAARNHHVLYNPASEIDLPKVERRLPKPALTASEAEQVLAQADLDGPLGIHLSVLWRLGQSRLTNPPAWPGCSPGCGRTVRRVRRRARGEVAGPAAAVMVVDDQYGGEAQQRLDRREVDLAERPGGRPWRPGEDATPLGTRLGVGDVEVVTDATHGSGDRKRGPRVRSAAVGIQHDSSWSAPR